ncbi:MAG: immunoglobulin domain-containing protein [Acidobacteria bacterium]|nr:immunoglobulin domain-containing protein [Acidobacteriota bacterium]
MLTTTPLLNAPADSGVWSYTFKIRLTAPTGNVQFKARLSAGSHNFTGNSLQLKGSSVFSLGTIGIFKPGVLPGSPDLALTKSGPDNATPGQTITYTLNYQNKSSATNAATGVQLVDTLPSNVTYVPNSCVGCSVVGNTVTWDLGTLANDGVIRSKAFQVTVAPGISPQTITNNAEIFLAENDVNSADNRASKSTIINNSPSISTQPADAAACVGGSVTFSVVASGAPAPTYQWRKNGVNITNATSSSYTISPVSASNAASYDVVVSNSAGTATSNAAVLTVNTPPSITTQPASATTKLAGEAITFTVAASGSNLSYQWRKGGTAILNATTSSYTIDPIAVSDAGSYDVVVSGSCNPSVTSSAAVLTVNKKMPIISWSNPADITYGTALGSTQLNATASYNGSSVEGNYSYSPVSGAVLNAGEQQNLSVTFTPTDTNTYDTPALKTVKINVLRKELTVTADNANRAYGAPNPSNLTHTITGYVNSETSSVVSGTPALTIANTATATAAAGSTHTITAALGTLSANNYSFAFVNGTLTIDKAVLQVSATGTMTYGGTPTLTPSYSGFIGTDNASVVTGTPTLSCSTCSGAGAGTTQTINVTNGSPALSATNYSFNFVNGSLTVSKAVLQVSATGSMTYGGTPTLTPSYTGFITGEGVSVLNGTTPALSCSGCTGAAAGSTQTITVAAGNLAASNYSFNFVNGSLTVDKAVLQVSATGSMTYGGTPTLTPTYSGFIGTDNASVITGTPNLSCTTCNGAAAGTTQTINVANGSPALSATNYNFNFVNGSLTVSKAALQVSATGSMTYGGTPTLTPSYSGFVGTDNTSVITGTPTLACPTCSGAAAGSTKTINVTDGNPALSATNYSFSFVNGSLTVDKAVLTVKADNLSRAYGDANPTPTYTINGFVNSENATSAGVTGTPTLSIAATASATAAAGTTHVITVDSISGMSAVNYNFTPANGTLTITLRAVTVKAANASKTYGDPTPSYSIQLANGTLATGDNLGSLGTAIFTTTPANPVDVGTYPIDVSGLSNSNYNISYATGTDRGALTINKASSTVVVSFGTGPYTFRGSAFTATARVMGVGGLDAAVTPVNYTGDCTNVTTTNGCTASATYAGDTNHNGSEYSASITISKASATVVANNKSKSYGDDNPALDATVTGTINGDSLNFSLATTAVKFSGVSNYPITVTLGSNPNYSVTPTNGTLAVNAKTATVTANNKSKTYGDTVTFAGDEFTTGGFINGDSVTSVTLTSTGAAATAAVNSYDIVASSAVGTGLNNYSITYNKGTLTVEGKPLTITANNRSKEYGSTMTTGTGQTQFSTGNGQLINGDTVTSVTLSSNGAAATAGVNTYDIITSAAVGTGIANYSITYSKGTLTVTRATLTVTANNASRYYGASNPTFSASVTGFKNNEVLATSGVTGSPSLTTTATGPLGSAAGSSHTIAAAIGGLASGNYDFSFVNGTLSIIADPTAITLDNKTSGINFDCASNTYTATVRDTVTTAGLSGVPLKLTIGTQTATATTNNDGVATFTLTLNQPIGSVTESVQLDGSWSDSNRVAPVLVSRNFTVNPSPNVSPALNGTSLYTGSLFFWTTSSTSSTATLTLSATIRDTGICLNDPSFKGDITKAKVSFQISTNGGGSFSPVSSAQNLPVGLVNPTDTSVGTASAISQYNIGNDQSVTLTVRVVVNGQYYNLNATTYDQLITIGKSGTANSLMGGGKVTNDKIPFPANGFLGLNSIESSFGSQVTYNKSGANPQGQVQVYIRSCNKSDGSVDPNCDPGKAATHHVYFIKSNSISELSNLSGSASFGSKTNVSEVLADGTKVGLDGGGTMQIVFTPFGKAIPRDMYLGTSATCNNNEGCMSITAYKSSGGVWYSSAWGSTGTLAPHTYVKNVLPGGAIAVQ